MISTPRCFERGCRHLLGVTPTTDEAEQRPTCVAFPDGIPDFIAYGDDLHLTPVPGDHGVTYEKEDDNENAG